MRCGRYAAAAGAPAGTWYVHADFSR